MTDRYNEYKILYSRFRYLVDGTVDRDGRVCLQVKNGRQVLH